MAVPTRSSHIEMIPIDAVQILNPRARNRRQHREIVDNISTVGLKRPITVSRREAGDRVVYDVVCGEGRIEAFRLLGQREIPALVIDATEEDCLLMSLVENIARRPHRAIDLMAEIGQLARRGQSDTEIAERVGVSRAWVHNVLVLLERGEERLLSAVETGLIPMAMAAEIALAKEEEVQSILMEAYESGKIKGKKVSAIRRLLDLRAGRHRRVKDRPLGMKNEGRRPTAEDLLRIFQREAEKQRLLARKAEFAQARLLFIVEALKDLLADEGFVTLLRAEELTVMPRALASRVEGRAPA